MSPAEWSIKNISKLLFHLVKYSTKIIKIIQFDKVNVLKSISLKESVWREILELVSNSTFSKKKKSVLQKCEFSISYNNVVVTKQIYLSPTFLKSWSQISDYIEDAVGRVRYPKYY